MSQASLWLPEVVPPQKQEPWLQRKEINVLRAHCSPWTESVSGRKQHVIDFGTNFTASASTADTEPYCTGCELCIPVCPVDCIALEPVDANLTGWQAWSQDLANVARARYDAKTARLARLQKEEEQRLEALANTRKAGS